MPPTSLVLAPLVARQSAGSSPPLSTGAIAGLAIGMVIATAFLIWLFGYTSFCNKPPYEPSEEELRTIWMERGAGKLLERDPNTPGCIVSRDYTGFPSTIQHGQWVGGPRGTHEEELGLWKRYRRYESDMNAGGGGGGG